MNGDTAENLPSLSDIRSSEQLKPLKGIQRRFIMAYLATGRIRPSARIAKCALFSHYNWLEQSEDYKKAFAFAESVYTRHAEEEVYNRAFVGEQVAVKKGKSIEIRTQKSDILAMFWLKGALPNKYRDNATVNNFIGPSKISIGTPTLQQSTVIDVTDDSK